MTISPDLIVHCAVIVGLILGTVLIAGLMFGGAIETAEQEGLWWMR